MAPIIALVLVTLLARLAGWRKLGRDYAVFPANVYAALHHIPFGGEPATPLLVRTIEQLVFMASVLWAGFGDSFAQHQAVRAR